MAQDIAAIKSELKRASAASDRGVQDAREELRRIRQSLDRLEGVIGGDVGARAAACAGGEGRLVKGECWLLTRPFRSCIDACKGVKSVRMLNGNGFAHFSLQSSDFGAPLCEALAKAFGHPYDRNVRTQGVSTAACAHCDTQHCGDLAGKTYLSTQNGKLFLDTTSAIQGYYCTCYADFHQ